MLGQKIEEIKYRDLSKNIFNIKHRVPETLCFFDSSFSRVQCKLYGVYEKLELRYTFMLGYLNRLDSHPGEEFGVPE